MRSIKEIRTELGAIYRQIPYGGYTPATVDRILELREELNRQGRTFPAGSTLAQGREAARQWRNGPPRPAQRTRKAPTHTSPRERSALARKAGIFGLTRDNILEPDVLLRAPYGEVRDFALAQIERHSATLTPGSQDRLDTLVRTRDKSTDGRLIARRIAATGSKPYEAAFEKGMRHKVPALTPEEVRALAVFREVQHAEMRAADEGHGFAGGFGIPYYVDPTLIVTTLDQAEIGNAARIVTITTDKWHGVSTPGVSSGFTAENTVVADGSPTLTQPAIDVFADKFYVPASLELTQDYPNWLGEITTLMMNQWASDVSQYCSIGNGTGQPMGVVSRMASTTQSPSHCVVTTAGQLGAVDLRTAWGALPERYRMNASWYCSPSMVSRISSLAAASVANGALVNELGCVNN